MAIEDRAGGPVRGRPWGGLGRLAASLAASAGDRLPFDAGAPEGVRSRLPTWAGPLSARTDDDDEEEVTVDPRRLTAHAAVASQRASTLADLVDERTVDVDESIDEDAFFSTGEGETTVTNRYDLEKAVPPWRKTGFAEVERYWVTEPYAFVVIFHARAENERKYFLVEPHLTPHEAELRDFLAEKLRATLEYGHGGRSLSDASERARVLERTTRRLLSRYGLRSTDERRLPGGLPSLAWLDRLPDSVRPTEVGAGEGGSVDDSPGSGDAREGSIEGLSARPEPAVLADEDPSLSEYQVRKLLYYLRRDFVGYERIDGIKHDVNVEDVSCDGYDSPVFVYHGTYENLVTNVSHGRDELDDFVVKLAQRSGKAISKRQPQVDATLPDDSRAQLTLGREVSDHGTNYTIRQFREVPFTPVDLINWRTYSVDQMAYLWLAIENGRSMLFAGGTASGKTTSLNAMSLFVPSNAKVVSIEDTREVELPHRNWVASVTRPSLAASGRGDVDEFDLLEAALRQRPDYIVMGEVRGEEGRTLFQITSTGHTTYTTFHAGSVDEVIKRFTNAPIDVSKTLFTSLDLISVQAQTRLGGRKVRRNKTITEVTGYDAGADEIFTDDVYRWRAEGDAFEQVGESGVLEQVAADRGWTAEELDDALFERRAVLAYLVANGLTTYAQVAATIQAYISDPALTLSLMADGTLADHLDDLRRIENVAIDIDDRTEALVPRPEPDDEVLVRAESVLEDAEERLFDRYRGADADVGSMLATLSSGDAGSNGGDGRSVPKGVGDPAPATDGGGGGE